LIHHQLLKSIHHLSVTIDVKAEQGFRNKQIIRGEARGRRQQTDSEEYSQSQRDKKSETSKFDQTYRTDLHPRGTPG